MLLFVNDKKVGEGWLAKTAWGRFTGEDFDIGEDTGSRRLAVPMPCRVRSPAR